MASGHDLSRDPVDDPALTHGSSGAVGHHHPMTHRHVGHFEEHHRSNRAGWLRASILGANDGLVSTACLIVGVAGSGASHTVVRTAGIAGLVAGALSMAVGEYVSVASQRDIEHADLEIERKALRDHPDDELRELTAIWEARGLDADVAATVARQLTARDALAAHARDEIGLTELTSARPSQAAFSSAIAFSVGALIPLLVYLGAPSAGRSPTVMAASVVALVALGVFGAAVGGAPRVRAALRVGIGGAVAMAVTMGIGELTGATLG